MARPNLRSLRLNWTGSDAALDEKMKMLIKNNWIKFSTGSNCCGNHGEPGC